MTLSKVNVIDEHGVQKTIIRDAVTGEIVNDGSTGFRNMKLQAFYTRATSILLAFVWLILELFMVLLLQLILCASKSERCLDNYFESMW